MQDFPIISAKNIGGIQKMTDIILNFLICIFEAFMFYDFLHDFFEKRTKNGYIIISVLGIMAVSIGTINYFQIMQLNLIGVGIVFLLGTVFLFYGSLKKKMSYWLIFYSIMLGMEFVVAILFTIMTSSQLQNKEYFPSRDFFITLICKLMTYVVLRLVKMFFQRKEVVYSGKLLNMTFILPVTTILIYFGLVQVLESKIFLWLGCILLLFCNVLVFYIIGKLIYVTEQNREYDLINLQYTLNHAYYERLEEVEEKHKQYAHDLKEYLQTISGLAISCKNEEIVSILKDMEVEINSISDKIYTNNRILNALICEKELQAQKNGIEISIMIEPELDLNGIKQGDLIVMTGNLIDNAIEGAMLCKEKKKIDLKFFASEDNFIVLDIENTYGNKIKRKGEQYISTKKDLRSHGIGIKSVREIAGKYGGMLFLEPKEDVFVSILTLAK